VARPNPRGAWLRFNGPRPAADLGRATQVAFVFAVPGKAGLRFVIRHALISLLASLFILPAVARAELRSNQVAIVAAHGNAESEQLAAYYATARAIPVTRICLIDVPAEASAGDELSADAWDSAVRPAIHRWLADNDPDGEIRCLVTIYGVPIKIAAAAPTPAQARYRDFLAGERTQRLALLRDAIKQFDALAPAGEITTDGSGHGRAGASAPASTAAAAPPTPPLTELKQIEVDLERALKAAQGRLAALPLGEKRSAAQTRMQQLVATAGGATVIVSNIEQQLGGQLQPNPTLAGELQRLRGAGSAWMESRDILERQPPGIHRDAALLGIIERLGGQLAAIPWIDAQLNMATRNETGAALDSELALIHWDAGYERLRYQPNYLNRNYDSSDLRRAFPTLMTARLDGPTPAAIQAMIDAAVAAERNGLQGNAYLDARGIASAAGPAPGVSPETLAFDRALLAAAQSIEAQTSVPVILNQPPTLFAAGECPDAALYCGWYSLGNYIDAFEWSPGAVAYHVAGDEAGTLHDPKSQRWCKRLLEDGAAATIGSVGDASPAAFPRPDALFGLLLRGDFTLAECYWQSLPYTSWTLTLLGDPLYRPYKNVRVQREEASFREPGR
jgi:uncharacterized protein (TIGR03790 family)